MYDEYYCRKNSHDLNYGSWGQHQRRTYEIHNIKRYYLTHNKQLKRHIQATCLKSNIVLSTYQKKSIKTVIIYFDWLVLTGKRRKSFVSICRCSAYCISREDIKLIHFYVSYILRHRVDLLRLWWMMKMYEYWLNDVVYSFLWPTELTRHSPWGHGRKDS